MCTLSLRMTAPFLMVCNSDRDKAALPLLVMSLG
jgi:hypothetical protein